VQRLQGEEARDMTLDARLFAACEAETKGEGPCAGVAAGGGRLRACLEKEAAAQKVRLALWKARSAGAAASKVGAAAGAAGTAANGAAGAAGAAGAEAHPPASLSRVSAECVKQLHESELVRADSIALHPGLQRACAADRERLCPGVPARGGAVMSCLSAHHADTLLAPECRAKLHEYTARQLSDFRLNPVLVAACAADIVNSSCGALRLGGGQVLGCRLEPSPAPAPSTSPAPSPSPLTLTLTPTPTPNPHPSLNPSPNPG